MAGYRKLSLPSDQRRALLRNQVTELLDKGRIQTTLDRAKEVRRIAEKLITSAIKECDNVVEVTKTVQNDKKQSVEVTVKNDMPSRLAARRAALAYIYDVPMAKQDGESKSEYAERTGDIKHPVVDRLFSELGPKYKKRAEDLGQGGGYTRIVKLGSRLGDGSEMVVLELV